ncbi:virulence RhuM family protein [Thiomicrospira microaerophila]|uniref:virulence RhuM family protein n=1 Tax=Thiomicrospira microaerophila TaxID=406020 RepID=UPI00200F039E|nr:RhuM family protein [Thiomicrospira microaerophila]UQB43077.1 virulence RhuM family protein [Thiomicrospira microaerophila]
MKNPIEIFSTDDNKVSLQVSLEGETVWLSRQQLSLLFDRDIKTIGKHLANVFKDGELEKSSVVAKFATTAEDGKVYKTEHYNLDVIISVGYRVKSQRGVKFRQWATKVLNQYLVQGYALNEKRLQERHVEFEQAIALLSATLTNQALVNDDGQAVLLKGQP